MTILIVRNGKSGKATTARGTPFGALLADHLRERRLTQFRFSELCEVDHSYISRICAGSRTPGRDMALRMARELDLDPVQTKRFLAAAGFAVTTEPQTAAPLMADVAALNDALALMDPVAREHALAMVRGLTALVGGNA